MKNKSIFLLSVIILSTALQCSAAIVSAADQNKTIWDDYNILASNIRVEPITDLGSTIPITVSGVSILEPLKPAGQIKINDSYVIYKAQLKIRFEVVIETRYSDRDLNVRTDQITEQWARIFTCEKFNEGYDWVWKVDGPNRVKSYDYNPAAYYKPIIRSKEIFMYEPTIQLSNQIMQANPNSFGYSGDIEFRISTILPPTNFQFGNIIVESVGAPYIGALTQSIVIESNQWKIQGPTPVLNEQIPSISLSGISFGEVSTSTVENQLKSLSVGVRATDARWATVVGGESARALAGSTLQGNASVLRNIKIYPDIKRRVQNYQVNFGQLDVDTATTVVLGVRSDFAGISRTYGAVPSNIKERTVAFTVDNYAQKYTIESSFDIYSPCKLIAQKTDAPPLENPSNETHVRDSTYWDNYVTGTTELKLIETENDLTPWATDLIKFWQQNWWWIITIIVIVAVLGLVIYIKLSVPSLPPINVPEKYRYPR